MHRPTNARAHSRLRFLETVSSVTLLQNAATTFLAMAAAVCAASAMAVAASVGAGERSSIAPVGIKKTPAKSSPCKNSPPLIAVDIGHTKARRGATSARGRREFDFNRRFASELFDLSQAQSDLRIALINGDGRIKGLRSRLRQAENRRADAFVSIHHDSAQPHFFKPWMFEGRQRFYADQFSGYSVFVSEENSHFGDSRRLAALIAERWNKIVKPTLHHAAKIKGENRKLLDRSLGIYDAPFVVIREARFPAVLLEVGVLINRQEEKNLNRRAYRKRMQLALLDGLRAFCGLRQSSSE